METTVVGRGRRAEVARLFALLASSACSHREAARAIRRIEGLQVLLLRDARRLPRLAGRRHLDLETLIQLAGLDWILSALRSPLRIELDELL